MLVQKVVAVKRLQEMGLISAFTNQPVVMVYPQILKLNDKNFMTNWCRNIREVWIVQHHLAEDQSEDQLEIKVYDKVSGELICRFSDQLIMNF